MRKKKNKLVKTPKKLAKKKVFKKKLELVLSEGKKGKLNIGKSKKKVKSKRQMLAIALSEADKAAKRGSIRKSKKKR